MDFNKIEQIFKSMTPNEISDINKKNELEHIKQSEEFKQGYKNGNCYLCGKPFKTISTENPCLHWLLRECNFRKKDFPKIFNKFSYHNIAAFVRWCANMEKYLSNINDLHTEKKDNKLISYTVKWKHIEWTFDCSENDFSGHKNSANGNFPHYHFQMRINKQQFINFNDYHIPFKQEDIFAITVMQNKPSWFNSNFGSIGSGMNDAMRLSAEDILEHSTNTADENNAVYNFSTIIDASDNPISGEELYEMQQEALRTQKSISHVAQKRLKDRAKIQTIISPAETIPDIAERTEHKPR